MKKIALLSLLAVMAVTVGACKSKPAPSAAPPAPAGYIDSGK